ncbi:MAG: hypothetical protein ACRD32_04500 [Nitrososphaerales archaeon]
MSEDRGALYKIRWEILIMAVALILSAVTVLALPHDFGSRIIKEQKEQQALMQKQLEIKEQVGLNQTGNKSSIAKP